MCIERGKCTTKHCHALSNDLEETWQKIISSSKFEKTNSNWKTEVGASTH
jgi:hypothetical protein